MKSPAISGKCGKLVFETICDEDNSSNELSNSFYIGRAKVFGGWLVYQSWDKSFQKGGGPGVPPTAGGMGIGTGLTFVPDPGHAWNLDDYS